MASWKWAAARCRGTSHEKSGTRLQDASAAFLPSGAADDTLFVVVCDGAGSATAGGHGASLICRSIGNAARRHFSTASSLPPLDLMQTWVDVARDQIFAVAERRQVLAREFASTLICVISNASETVVAHVGDGCAVAKDALSGEWHALSWPDHGEYVSNTSFVTDEPPPKVRLTRYESAVSSLVVFSDGLERLALDFARKRPESRFFEGVTRPLMQGSGAGRDAQISGQLGEFLNSPAVNERTDDDKTLVLAVRR